MAASAGVRAPHSPRPSDFDPRMPKISSARGRRRDADYPRRTGDGSVHCVRRSMCFSERASGRNGTEKRKSSPTQRPILMTTFLKYMHPTAKPAPTKPPTERSCKTFAPTSVQRQFSVSCRDARTRDQLEFSISTFFPLRLLFRARTGVRARSLSRSSASHSPSAAIQLKSD